MFSRKRLNDEEEKFLLTPDHRHAKDVHNEIGTSNEHLLEKDRNVLPQSQALLSSSSSSLSSSSITTALKREPATIEIPLVACGAYFFFNGSTACIMPYLSVFFHDLGVDATSIGLLSSIRTFTTIFAAPIWGAISAKFNILHVVLLGTYTFSVIIRMSLLIIERNSDGDTNPNIYMLALITGTFSFFHSPVQTLLDSSVIRSLPSGEKSSFGRFRLWGKLGNSITSIIMGHSIYKIGYQFAFWTHFLLSIPATFCIATFHDRYSGNINNNPCEKITQSKDKKKSDSRQVLLLDGLRTLFKDVQLIFAMIQILLTGFSFGLAGTFSYVLVRERAERDQRESGIDLMFCRLFLSIGGISMYYVSKNIIKIFEYYTILVTSLFLMGITFLLYTMVDYASNPITLWTSLFVAELLRGGTFALFWSTILIHVDQVSPKGTNTMMLTIMESIYRGFGHTLGGILGGILISRLGSISDTFWYVGILILLMACLSSVFIKIIGLETK